MNFSMLIYFQGDSEPSDPGKKVYRDYVTVEFKLIPQHFFPQGLLRWIPFPSLSQAASTDLTFPARKWRVSAIEETHIGRSHHHHRVETSQKIGIFTFFFPLFSSLFFLSEEFFFFKRKKRK